MYIRLFYNVHCEPRNYVSMLNPLDNPPYDIITSLVDVKLICGYQGTMPFSILYTSAVPSLCFLTKIYLLGPVCYSDTTF